jgi:hypothetical protein
MNEFIENWWISSKSFGPPSLLFRNQPANLKAYTHLLFIPSKNDIIRNYSICTCVGFCVYVHVGYRTQGLIHAR